MTVFKKLKYFKNWKLEQMTSDNPSQFRIP